MISTSLAPFGAWGPESTASLSTSIRSKWVAPFGLLAGVIHHSDQGTQYTSLGFGQRCHEAGVRPSMGTVGDCYGNALCESFFATLECELLDRRRFRNQAEPARLCSSFWKVGTTPVAVIQPWAT